MADHLDEFESIFKRAERERFVFAEIPIQSVALITDRDGPTAQEQQKSVEKLLPRLGDDITWHCITDSDFSTVAELLECVNKHQTDLIVTWRHLQEESLIPQHSLGVYLDVLTQTTSIPVLVLPGTAEKPRSLDGIDCDRVMVVADHITGDNRLINYGVRLCRNGGCVWLCHVEDERVFRRYMDAIGRIPEIDTDDAERLISEQLLKEAQLFVDSCIETIETEGPNLGFESVVRFGHFLREYEELIRANEIDLVVANTKDDDQLAMHGIAYSLSIELADVPMLLL